MAYPPGVITRQVSVGGAVTVEAGEELGLVVTTKSSRSLVWVANGWRLESIAKTYQTIADGAEIFFDLPVTDQNGYLDAETRQAIIVEPGEASHLYTSTLEIFQDEAKIREYVIGPYAVPQDSSVLDLDVINPSPDPVSGTLTVYIPGPEGAVSNLTNSTVASYITTDGETQTAINNLVNDRAAVVASEVATDTVADNPAVVSAAAALAQSDAGLARVIPTKNRYDGDTDSVGFYILPANGSLVALAGYRASDFIPVTPGEQITVNIARHWSFYNASRYQVPGSGGTQTPQAVQTWTVPAGAAYIRFSYDARPAAGGWGPGNVQLETGSAVTPWVAYGRILDPSITVASADQVLTAKWDSEVLSLHSQLGEKDIRLTLDVNPTTRNKVFNFLNAYDGGNPFHTISDSVAPIRCNLGAIGGNHGFAFCAYRTGLDKTAADLGSVWSDGTREYVILKIESGRCWVGGSYKTSPVDQSTASAAVSPSGPLTHVSGATHTTTIPATGFVVDQMYPAVANRTCRLWMDGAPLTGDVSGREVVVRETYDILDYASIYDQSKANVGVSYEQLNVRTLVRVESEWRIRAGLKMAAKVALTEGDVPVRLTYCGLFQVEALNNPAQQTRWLPGVGVVGGHNWSQGVPLADLTSNLYVTSSDSLRESVPVTTLVDWNSSTDIGQAVGYSPFTAGVSNSQQRVSNSPSRLWDLRNTKKIYPNATTLLPPGWGHVEGFGYRAYLTSEEKDLILAKKTDANAAAASLSALVSGAF